MPPLLMGRLRGLQARPGGVHSPLEHAAQAGKIEGPDAGGVPEPGPCGVVAILFSPSFGAQFTGTFVVVLGLSRSVTGRPLFAE